MGATVSVDAQSPGQLSPVVDRRCAIAKYCIVVAQWGDTGAQCRSAFGTLLRPTTVPAMIRKRISGRDGYIRQAARPRPLREGHLRKTRS